MDPNTTLVSMSRKNFFFFISYLKTRLFGPKFYIFFLHFPYHFEVVFYDVPYLLMTPQSLYVHTENLGGKKMKLRNQNIGEPKKAFKVYFILEHL
jgi:hypothetical protein